jgi:hypothetical protein
MASVCLAREIGFASRLCCRLRPRYIFMREGSSCIRALVVASGERLDEHSIDLIVEPSDYRHQLQSLLSSQWSGERLSPGAQI